MKEYDCKNFKPGEVVEFVASPGNLFQVIERDEQTCHGGTQVFYVGRIHGRGNISTEWKKVCCVELRPIQGDGGRMYMALQDAWSAVPVGEKRKEIREAIQNLCERYCTEED